MICICVCTKHITSYITVKKISTHPKAELKQALVLCETSCVTHGANLGTAGRIRSRCVLLHMLLAPEVVTNLCWEFTSVIFCANSSCHLRPFLHCHFKHQYIRHGVEIMYVSKVSVAVEGQAASSTDNSTCQGHWCILVSTPIYVFWFAKDG